jgi:hypothetical protein
MQVLKGILVLAALIAVAFAPSYVLGHGNERGTATADVEGGVVKVEYGRPMLKGRDMMSKIEPGGYWRVGADKATTLSTDVDLLMGGDHSISRGEYKLFAKFHGDDKWTLVLAEGSERGKPQGEIAEVPMMVMKLDSPVEMLTIKLSAQDMQGKLTIEWGTIQMVADFRTS